MNERPVPGSDSVTPIALTMGEPAGIGAEIAIKAWAARASLPAPFVLIDDVNRVRETAGALRIPVRVAIVEEARRAAAVFGEALPVLHRQLPAPVAAGRPDPRNAPAVVAAIETAVSLVRTGEAVAVVTNPIQKKTLYEGGFPYPGHTEFLAALADDGSRPVMMLVCSRLRVVPVTVHLSLRRAIDELAAEDIVAVARIAHDALHRDFGIERPRLAVAGLNPHAGEAGEMGDEEERIVSPAVARLASLGIDAQGPLPPDTMFSARARAGYDAAICMYHDQALIPLKTLDFDGGVNVTLGLPFVRTSPDHGTALDIAGTGTADPSSLLEALRLAAELAAHRACRR